MSARDDASELFAAVGRILARGAWPALAAMIVVGVGACAAGALAGAAIALLLGILELTPPGTDLLMIIAAIARVGAIGMTPAFSAGALAGFHRASLDEPDVRGAIALGARSVLHAWGAWLRVFVLLSLLVILGYVVGAVAVYFAAAWDPTAPQGLGFLLVGAVAGGAFVVVGFFFVAVPVLVLGPAREIADVARHFESRPSLSEGARRRRAMLAVAALAPIAVLLASQPSAVAVAVTGGVVGSAEMRIAAAIAGAFAFICVHALFAAAALEVVTRAWRESSDAA